MTTLCPNCNAPMLDWAQSRSCPNCGIETDLYGKVTQQPVRLIRHDLSDTATDLMIANAEVKTLKAELERLKSTNAALESSLYNAEMNLEHITAEYEELSQERRYLKRCVGGLSCLLKGINGQMIYGKVLPIARAALEFYREKYPSAIAALDSAPQDKPKP